jgi:diadenosine tetraphosphatase ApaH/serine/threonine PP2A family protein phosphatase
MVEEAGEIVIGETEAEKRAIDEREEKRAIAFALKFWADPEMRIWGESPRGRRSISRCRRNKVAARHRARRKQGRRKRR